MSDSAAACQAAPLPARATMMTTLLEVLMMLVVMAGSGKSTAPPPLPQSLIRVPAVTVVVVDRVALAAADSTAPMVWQACARRGCG